MAQVARQTSVHRMHLQGAGQSHAFGIAAVVAGGLHQRLGEVLAGQGGVVDSRKLGAQQAAWQPVNSMDQYPISSQGERELQGSVLQAVSLNLAPVGFLPPPGRES